MPALDTPAAVRDALTRVASNFSFTWTRGARALFSQLDPGRFAALGHNPTALLAELGDDDLEAAMSPEYLERLALVLAALDAEARRRTWWERREAPDDVLVAYFSAEFGLDESLPIYSGGLGILAGDHLKSASGLGVPLVGVGLLYRRGYFRQRLDDDDRQVERYPRNDTARLPLRPVPMAPVVQLADQSGRLVPVRLGVWQVRVGRVALYLLDTKVEGNPDWARAVTDTLYGGDRENRLRQELVLGVGGVRVLRKLGLEPTVFHLNEGHSAFLQLERLRELVEEGGVDRDAALGRLRASTIFTTHTPVPAGNEVFDPALVERNVSDLVQRCGFTWPEFAALGRGIDDDPGFGLTPFALRTAAFANGVSVLHGDVSREMWRDLWPGRSVDEAPIGSITNGVHACSWISEELSSLLGHEEDTGAPHFARALELDDGSLWTVHRTRKIALLHHMRSTRDAGASFDPDVLTLGFARRFATYKRAGLLFSDPERLAKLLADSERPLQIVFAGKAHPADEGGKDLIQQVVDFAREPKGMGRIVFLEDYEMTLARYLVQGVDVWLNTPRRPLEASGTSGMKAALNGVVNCSILDGWWAEAYSEETGFAIPSGPAGDDESQDAADAEALFDVLEGQVIPAFYDRDERGVPARWLALMRNSIAQLGARYNTDRMVAEYVDRFYLAAQTSKPSSSSELRSSAASW